MTENINMLIDNINSLLIDVNNKKEIKEENDAKNQLRKDYLKYNQFVIGIKIKIQENRITYKFYSFILTNNSFFDVFFNIKKFF